MAGLCAGERRLTHKEIIAFAGKVYRWWVERFSDNPGAPATWAKVRRIHENAEKVSAWRSGWVATLTGS